MPPSKLLSFLFFLTNPHYLFGINLDSIEQDIKKPFRNLVWEKT